MTLCVHVFHMFLLRVTGCLYYDIVCTCVSYVPVKSDWVAILLCVHIRMFLLSGWVPVL